MAARSLMVLGTASHVGKSLITAAFCRIFARFGWRVAPFKAQNMSLNSAATIDGYEIGRAQALQAEAAGIFATREMNPILLKPDSDASCQIVVDGRVWGHLSARDYHQHRVEELFPLVLKSYHKLAAENDLVVLEGAGSPAEINLKAHDIVNMRMAAAANAACLLVGDIDRGGVFASLLGTMELLSADERECIRGFVINKFRGDFSLLKPGIREIENRIQKPCVGVVPYIPDLDLDEEDSVGLDARRTKGNVTSWQATTDGNRPLRIAVIDLPYLSNFTDFDALAAEPSVSLDFVSAPEQIQHADLIIIPGTKQTIQDFRWLRSSGLADAIECHAGHPLVVGICGGMQMMGISIADPHGMEGGGQVAGIGLLPIHTVLALEKVTAQVKAELVAKTLFGLECPTQETTGYEIHLGETTYDAGAQPIFRIRRRHESQTHPDGVQDQAGRCFGTYLHGLFDDDGFRHSFLANARAVRQLHPSTEVTFRAKQKQAEINRIADAVEQSVDLDAIRGWLGISMNNIQDKHETHSRSERGNGMMDDLLKTIAQIARVEPSWMAQARERQDHLTKPPGSLGRLEEIACRMAAIQQTLVPSVDHKRIVVFAADHGVAEEGVSPYPAEVTAQMVANFLRGGAAINALAKTAGADLVIVDAGVKSAIPVAETSSKQIQFIQKPIRKGSRNFIKEPALTADETDSAIRLGLEIAVDAKIAGVKLIGIGEMGIGNTTAAAAITAALTGLPAARVTGRGTGADEEVMAKKRSVVDQALRRYGLKADDPLSILQTLGGLEVAGLVGVCLGAAAAKIAIVCDGFIATASAALAVRLCPASADYIFAAHLSTEPGHAVLLHIIGHEPLLKLEMRLGEGTGAALAMNIIDAAVNAFTGMATFESAGVSNNQVLMTEV